MRYTLKIYHSFLAIPVAGLLAIVGPAGADHHQRLVAAAEEKHQAPAQYLVDLNSASEAELDALPGVTVELARKIMSGRPYTQKEELQSRSIVPPEVYQGIKDRITVRPMKLAE